MLPGPSSRSTTFDDELSLRWFPRLIIPPWTTSLNSSLCPTRGPKNILLHHSFDLMSSPTDYISMKPLDRICHGHHQHSEFLQDINWIHDEKYHPCPSMICVIIDNILAFPSTQTCSCLVLYLEILAIQLMLCSTLEYYHLLCEDGCENFTTS